MCGVVATEDEAIEATADRLAQEDLPFAGLNGKVQALAVLFQSIKGLPDFLKDHAIGRNVTVYIEKPPGTQYATFGPGSIRLRTFKTVDQALAAMAQAVIGLSDIRFDEPHEVLGEDWILVIGPARWHFKSGPYRRQRARAEIAAKAGHVWLGLAEATGTASTYLKRGKEVYQAGKARAGRAAGHLRKSSE